MNAVLVGLLLWVAIGFLIPPPPADWGGLESEEESGWNFRKWFRLLWLWISFGWLLFSMMAAAGMAGWLLATMVGAMMRG